MNDEELAEMMQRATDGRDHEWAWYTRDVPTLIEAIRDLRADLDAALHRELAR